MWSLILKWMKFWEKDKLNINLYIGVEQMIKWNSNVFNIFSLFFLLKLDLNLETIYMMAPPSNDRNKKTNKKKTFLSRHVE